MQPTRFDTGTPKRKQHGDDPQREGDGGADLLGYEELHVILFPLAPVFMHRARLSWSLSTGAGPAITSRVESENTRVPPFKLWFRQHLKNQRHRREHEPHSSEMEPLCGFEISVNFGVVFFAICRTEPHAKPGAQSHP